MASPFRACSGDLPLGGSNYCGKRSTVVCTERTDGRRPLQWYACDEHRAGEFTTEPIDDWFRRLDNKFRAEPGG